MNARIVADGAKRLRQSPELEAKLQALWTNIHAQYADEWARSLYFSRVITENASPSRSDVDVHD